MNRSKSRASGASLAAAIGSVLATAASAGSLSGRISDGSGVGSLGGAEVRIVELGRTASAGSDGIYRFGDVPAGDYTVRASYAGAQDQETTVTVTDTDVAVADLALGPAVDSYIDNVLVVGQRANLASSISRQRSSDTVESVITRDAMGQFPDQNVAEATRRAAGVNVLNDQGEGRFISVRGLDPDLNAASINGARVPAPEADVRSVALDVIPTELVESIEIKKSLTPDMDADAIGASIEIQTTSAFDRRKPLLAFSAENSYNDLSSESSPKASIDFSRLLTDRLGVAGGISYYKRKFSTDNIEAEGWDVSDGIAFADTVQYRDYDVERERLGASLSLDFKATDATTLYSRLLSSRFDDQEYRGRLKFEMDEAPTAGTASTAEFSSADGEIQVTRDIKDRFESQKISSFVLGGETFAGPWTYQYSASWSKARERESGSLDPTAFEHKFDGAGALDVMFDYSRSAQPRFTVSPATQAAFLDPAAYRFDKLERTTLSLSEDEEATARFDIKREFGLAKGDVELQFGAKARLREKANDLKLDVFDGFDGELTLADMLGSPTYGLANISPVPSPGTVRGFFNTNGADFELDPVDTAFESNSADYSVKEDIYAGYLMARYETGPWRAIAGVRVENTRNDINANRVDLVEEGGVRNGETLDEDTVFVTPVSFNRNYTDWLPSANLRFEASDAVVLRAGLYRSVVRPKVGDLAPRFIVEESDDGEREGEFGNPALEPYQADNLDLSAEWYFDRNAVLQAGLFYKDIDNFIFTQAFENESFNGVLVDAGTRPINGDSAEIKGLEFSYQQALTSLPAPFDGTLLGFNYTYTDSSGTVDGRRTPLKSASRNTWNALVGYEIRGISLRLAATYRDRYLDELGNDAQEDRYVRDHLQFDLTAKYRFNDQVQAFVEFVNLNDEPYVAYQRGPGSERLLQYEEYSWTGKLGLRVTF